MHTGEENFCCIDEKGEVRLPNVLSLSNCLNHPSEEKVLEVLHLLDTSLVIS